MDMTSTDWNPIPQKGLDSHLFSVASQLTMSVALSAILMGTRSSMR